MMKRRLREGSIFPVPARHRGLTRALSIGRDAHVVSSCAAGRHGIAALGVAAAIP